MEQEGIKSVRVKDALCMANVIHLGAILGELSLDEVKEMTSQERR